MNATCPRCDRPRVEAAECPFCGVIYARAHASPPPDPVGESPLWTPEPAEPFVPTVDPEAKLELRLRLFALPACFAVLWLALQSKGLRFLIEVLFARELHECGHAVTAWLSGHTAMPLLWSTSWSLEREAPMIAIVLAANVALIVIGVRSRRMGFILAGAALLGLQLVLSFGVSAEHAKMWITFGGNAGDLVLGTALVATFYSPEGSWPRRGGLRWGFLVIGAASILSCTQRWFDARADYAAIPFGVQEGVGLSDSSRLVEWYRWGERELVLRYVHLAVLALGICAAIYLWGIWSARRQMQEG